MKTKKMSTEKKTIEFKIVEYTMPAMGVDRNGNTADLVDILMRATPKGGFSNQDQFDIPPLLVKFKDTEAGSSVDLTQREVNIIKGKLDGMCWSVIDESIGEFIDYINSL